MTQADNPHASGPYADLQVAYLANETCFNGPHIFKSPNCLRSMQIWCHITFIAEIYLPWK